MRFFLQLEMEIIVFADVHVPTHCKMNLLCAYMQHLDVIISRMLDVFP